MDFETNRDQLLHNHAMEKEEMSTRADRQIEELQEELAKVQRERDEALLLAENDRQQVRETEACVEPLRATIAAISQ